MSGISTNRSNITIPAVLASEILQKTQDESAVMRLARRIDLPGAGKVIPVISGDPEAAWVDETGAKAISNPSLSTKTMQAYKLAVIVPFSDEFARDARALYDELVRRLPLALAQKFDKTVFHGTAPGGNFDTFAGCSAYTMSGGSNNFYKALVAADADVSSHNGIVNGFAMSPQGKGEMYAAVDGDSRPLFINSVAEGAIPQLLGSPVVYSKGVYAAGTSGTSADKPDVLGFAGDWTQALYGTVEGIKIDFANQVTLPIGAEDAMVNLWQRNMFAVRAEIEVGFVADTACFAKIVRAHS